METAEGATNDIEQLSIQVDHARDEAQVLVGQLGTVEFKVGKQYETRVRQKALLEAVEALRRKFETFGNDPLRRGIYAAEISNFYLRLANTFKSETLLQIVPIEHNELATYKDMLMKATLDAASRKKRAAVMKAAAQISRRALDVARRLSMA